MKKYAIPVAVVLSILTLTWAGLGQEKETPAQRMRRERTEQAKRYVNMSEEERAKFRQQVQERESLIREDQEKAIEVIEQQLVRLKAAIQAQRPTGDTRDLTEEQRNKRITAFADRRAALQVIISELGKLQYRGRQAGENTQFMLVSTDDLKPIQEAAEKEKAGRTRKLIEVMIRSKTQNSAGVRPTSVSNREADK
jgi:hypothetical protein